jgi:beta-xylosidase
MEENPKGSWASIGVFVVNSKINQRLSRSKDKKSPYEIYFGNVALHATDTIDPALMKVATMEYGVSSSTQVIQLVFESNPDIKVSHQDLCEIIRDADGLFEDERVVMKKHG